MEFGGNRGQSNVNGNTINNNNNSSSTILGWDVWELNNNNNNDSSTMDWTSSSSNSAAFYGAGLRNGITRAWESEGHAPPQNSSQSVYGGSGVHPDPHLVCLKLGKRHYFEDNAAAAGIGRSKKGKGKGGGGGDALCCGGVPRCQVEGCHVALVNAKDYHRRHKVCEAHSKAPKAVVLGLEQRFCQQCSRFHVVSEFEETKRSCKRRLAGHNERRRKSSHDSIARNSSYLENKLVMLGGGFPYMLTTPSGRAHSLLSSKPEPNTSWGPNSDLSSRSSAALRELIAENRAAILARQLAQEAKDASWHASSHHHHLSSHLAAADDFGAGSNPSHTMFPELPHVTLDLMQAPGPPPAFGFVPGSRATNKAKAEEDDCCDLWSAF